MRSACIRSNSLSALAATLAVGLSSCASTEPLIIEPVAGTLLLRAVQSREFETTDEERLLEISSDVLVDLGFQIDASDEILGVIVASKERAAMETGQVLLSLGAALLGLYVPYDHEQLLRASITSHEHEDQFVLRATFQRIVWNNYGMVSRMEPLDQPTYYDEFFGRVGVAAAQEGLLP